MNDSLEQIAHFCITVLLVMMVVIVFLFIVMLVKCAFTPVVPPGVVHMPRRNVWRVDVAGRHIGSYSSITDAMQAHRQAVML